MAASERERITGDLLLPKGTAVWACGPMRGTLARARPVRRYFNFNFSAVHFAVSAAYSAMRSWTPLS
jgi:hypothetical protein